LKPSKRCLTNAITSQLRFWSPNYIQHSAHTAPGREGLFNLVKGQPQTLRYEPGVNLADGHFVERFVRHCALFLAE
jgi:hypothetical protein